MPLKKTLTLEDIPHFPLFTVQCSLFLRLPFLLFFFLVKNFVR
jgi:hypothetical protein